MATLKCQASMFVLFNFYKTMTIIIFFLNIENNHPEQRDMVLEHFSNPISRSVEQTEIWDISPVCSLINCS